METTKISKEELEKHIKDGTAKRIHLYDSTDILRPRGSLKKESLSLKIYELLKSYYEEWSNSKYSDSLPKVSLLSRLEINLNEEIQIGLKKFKEEVKNEN